MFGLFGRRASPRLATLTFDEAFCHSAGTDPAQTYRIPPNTTHLRFVFPDFDGFWQVYINRNPYLSDEARLALRDGQSVFAASVVEGAAYYRFSGVEEDGSITLDAETLQAAGPGGPFPGFTEGALAFGLYSPGDRRFQVLWATCYARA